MKPSIKHVNYFFLCSAVAMAIASIFLNDADKFPIYFLLAYVFWRLN